MAIDFKAAIRNALAGAASAGPAPSEFGFAAGLAGGVPQGFMAAEQAQRQRAKDALEMVQMESRLRNDALRARKIQAELDQIDKHQAMVETYLGNSREGEAAMSQLEQRRQQLDLLKILATDPAAQNRMIGYRGMAQLQGIPLPAQTRSQRDRRTMIGLDYGRKREPLKFEMARIKRKNSGFPNPADWGAEDRARYELLEKQVHRLNMAEIDAKLGNALDLELGPEVKRTGGTVLDTADPADQQLMLMIRPEFKGEKLNLTIAGVQEGNPDHDRKVFLLKQRILEDPDLQLAPIPETQANAVMKGGVQSVIAQNQNKKERAKKILMKELSGMGWDITEALSEYGERMQQPLAQEPEDEEKQRMQDMTEPPEEKPPDVQPQSHLQDVGGTGSMVTNTAAKRTATTTSPSARRAAMSQKGQQ